MTLYRFVGYYHLFGLVVAGFAVALTNLYPETPILCPHFWILFISVFVLTLIAYVVSDVGIRRGGELSVLGLLGGLFVKLLACLALVAVLIIKDADNKRLIAFNFFSLYFLFTAFEVTCLLRNLRDQNKT